MKSRKIYLTLDECSEVRILISRRVETIKSKLDTLLEFAEPSDSLDSNLISYWREKLHTLTVIFNKLCSTDIVDTNESCEVKA